MPCCLDWEPQSVLSWLAGVSVDWPGSAAASFLLPFLELCLGVPFRTLSEVCNAWKCFLEPTRDGLLTSVYSSCQRERILRLLAALLRLLSWIPASMEEEQAVRAQGDKTPKSGGSICFLQISWFWLDVWMITANKLGAPWISTFLCVSYFLSSSAALDHHVQQQPTESLHHRV